MDSGRHPQTVYDISTKPELSTPYLVLGHPLLVTLTISNSYYWQFLLLAIPKCTHEVPANLNRCLTQMPIKCLTL